MPSGRLISKRYENCEAESQGYFWTPSRLILVNDIESSSRQRLSDLLRHLFVLRKSLPTCAFNHLSRIDMVSANPLFVLTHTHISTPLRYSDIAQLDCESRRAIAITRFPSSNEAQVYGASDCLSRVVTQHTRLQGVILSLESLESFAGRNAV